MSDHIDHGLMAAIAHGVPSRSPHWPHVRAEHLNLQPACIVSGLTAGDGAEMEVHHVHAFHICVLLGRPDLELDLRNLRTIVRAGPPGDLHLVVGHLDNFESENEAIDDDAVMFHGQTEAAIRADPRWLTEEANRVKPFREWTDDEKTAYRATLDRLYPRAVVILP